MRRHVFGYTLPEFLIYIAVVSVVVLVMTQAVVDILRYDSKLRAVGEVTQNSRFVLDRMALAVRNASAVVQPETGATGTVLELTMPTAAISPTIFSVTNGRLDIKEGTAATSSLTADEVVTSLVFRNLTVDPNPATIEMELTMRAATSGTQAEFQFEQTATTTAVIRKRS